MKYSLEPALEAMLHNTPPYATAEPTQSGVNILAFLMANPGYHSAEEIFAGLEDGVEFQDVDGEYYPVDFDCIKSDLGEDELCDFIHQAVRIGDTVYEWKHFFKIKDAFKLLDIPMPSHEKVWTSVA